MLLDNWLHSDIAQWFLTPTDGASVFDCGAICTEGTRKSLLETIKDWVSESTPSAVFLLDGEAGSGKSTIAHTIAEHFAGIAGIGGGPITFFCSHKFSDTREQVYIIPTIAQQLGLQSKSFASALLNAAPTVLAMKDISMQMDQLLSKPWKTSEEAHGADFPPFLVIVDALDEIDGGLGFTFLDRLLDTVKNGNLCGIKFLITSRPDRHFRHSSEPSLPLEAFSLYDIPKCDLESEIFNYLTAKLSNLTSTVCPHI